MLSIEKTVLPSPEQWQIIIEGMRNPMNSWSKSDSYKTCIEDQETLQTADFEFFIGDADRDLMMRLANGGSVHAKYRRMIPVWANINAPIYWWKEFDTYKVGTVVNSCSTMHKIHDKELTLDNFSTEHLVKGAVEELTGLIKCINKYRAKFLETGNNVYWQQMIQLLPSSFNQKRTVMINYEVLAGIYKHRRNHKLDEWHDFCEWVEGLPYFKEIVIQEEKDGEECLS